MTREPRLTLFLYAATLLGVFTLAVSSLTEFDFWWYLKSGELIVQEGAVPATDPFSYTARGRPWVNHMWATQVLFYWLWTTLGRVSLIVAKSLVVTATFAVLLRTARARGVDPILACALVLLAAWAGRDFWDVRPQVVTYLLVAVFLWVLREGWERRRAPFLWLPLLMIPWANLHAGFVTGLGVIGLVGVGTALPRLAAAGARASGGVVLARAAGLLGATALASLANPFGWRALLFPLEVVNTRAFMIATHEWFSPNFHDPAYRGFEALLLLLVPAFAWGRTRLGAADVVVLLTFLHLAVTSIRHIPLFAVVAVVPLGASLQAALADLARGGAVGSAWRGRLGAGLPTLAPLARRRGGQLAGAAVLVGLGVAASGAAMVDPAANPFVLDLNEERYPRRTMTWIRERRVPAPIFNTYAWGGYELWRLYPDYQVFMDGRTHVYGSEILRDFLEVTTPGERWAAVLDKWRVQTILATRDSALATELQAAGGWRPVFEERDAVVFVRESAGNQDLLRDLPAVSLAPPDPAVARTLVEAMHASEAGDEDLAIRRYREALETAPDHPVALFSLGVLLEKRGATTEARALLERVAAGEPADALARRARDRLTRIRR